MAETKKSDDSLSPERFLTNDVLAGDPLQIGGSRIIPFARITQLGPRGPFRGFFWGRPASILIVNPDGRETVTPVYDYTRRVQWLLLAAGLVGSLLIRLAVRNNQ